MCNCFSKLNTSASNRYCVKLSTYFSSLDTVMNMTSKSGDRNNAEPTRKGTKKVNLNDLRGSLSKRGRARYSDPMLAEALHSLLAGEVEAFIWLDAVPTGATPEQVNSDKAKWRARAVSIFQTLSSGRKITVAWTDENEMVISLKG